MLKFIMGALKGGGLLTATAAGGTAAAVGVDATLNHGNFTKDIFGNVMKTLGISQAEGGIETQWFGFLKWIDTLVEAFVGMNGRSGVTDFIRSGLQGAMGLTPAEQELGSTARPSTLTNPRSEGYMGPGVVHPDPNVPAGTTQVVDADGKVVTVKADGTAPALPEGQTVTSSFENFGASLQAEWASIWQPRVVDGKVIEGESQLNWAGVGEVAAEGGKGFLHGVTTGASGMAGSTLDLLNGLDNMIGTNWIPDTQHKGGYGDQFSEGTSDLTQTFFKSALGGELDLKGSATANVFNVVGSVPAWLIGGAPMMAVKGATIIDEGQELLKQMNQGPAVPAA